MNLQHIRQYFYPHRILDIGANVGQFHTLCRSTFPASFIFSIEASPECESALSQITENYYIGLLAKEEKNYSFFSRRNDPTCTGNSIYKELTPFYNDEQVRIIEMSGILLDNLFDSNAVFDLIKIDTQGSELDIMSGGMRLCSRASGILLEVSLEQYNENSPLKSEVDLFMHNMGFHPVAVLGESGHPITHHIIQHDILYLRS